MSKCLTIVPIGPIRRDTLEFIAGRISDQYGLNCRISRRTERPSYAYDRARNQYNSKLVLQRLLQSHSLDSFATMGITEVDLYLPVLTFVFGLSQINGRCALVSLCRLRPEFYGHPPCETLLLSRLEKTVKHELGHSAGLTHCRDRGCVMYSSTRLEHTDLKGVNFCPSCHEIFCYRIARWARDTPANR